MPVRLADNSLGTRLARWARSANVVKVPQKQYQEGESICPYKWWLIDKEKNSFPDGIDSIWYRIDDDTAPSIKIKLGRDADDSFVDEFLQKGLCKPKNKDKAKEKIKNKKSGEYVTYKGTKNSDMKEAFKTAIESSDEASGDM